jgi:hypothetical protein
MRFRLMASYRGVPYEVGVGPADTDVVLFAACPPPEELGFEPATGHWRKRVSRAEVDALWESRPVGSFRGEPCLVLDDLGDRLHITYLGTDARRARDLGYWQVDRGVFELLTPRDEVSGLTEEKVEQPLHWTQPPSESSPVPSYPYGTAPQPAWPEAEFPAAGQNGRSTENGYRNGAGADPIGQWNGGGYLDQARGWGEPLDVPGPQNGLRPAAPAGGQGLDVTSPGSARRSRSREPGGRSARRQRVPTRSIFSELADLAAIPRGSYALEQEADGAMCIIRTPDGFEVFSAADGARHEVRTFDDEEAAYFYLFGVLAAEAVRNGSLRPTGRLS